MSAQQVSVNLGVVVISRSRQTSKITAWVYDSDVLTSSFRKDLEDSKEDYLAHFDINWDDVSPAMQTTLKMLDQIDERHDLADFIARLAQDVANKVEDLLADRMMEAVRRMEMPPGQNAGS